MQQALGSAYQQLGSMLRNGTVDTLGMPIQTNQNYTQQQQSKYTYSSYLYKVIHFHLSYNQLI